MYITNVTINLFYFIVVILSDVKINFARTALYQNEFYRSELQRLQGSILWFSFLLLSKIGVIHLASAIHIRG